MDCGNGKENGGDVTWIITMRSGLAGGRIALQLEGKTNEIKRKRGLIMSVPRLLIGLLFSPLYVSVINAGTVPLTLQNPSKTEYKNWPVTFGVPFAKGAAGPDDKFVLKDASGKEIPVQTEITSTWGLNGPVRWLLVDFSAELNGKEQQSYTLEYGKDLKNEKTEKSVSVKTLAQPFQGYEIQNGFLKLTVSKDRFNLFDKVMVSDEKGGYKTLAQNSTDAGPYLIDASGKIYMAAWGQPDEVKIEENGPLRVVVCAKGWYYSKEGEKFCRYIVRTHIFAEQPFVKVLYTFIITGDSDRAKFNDIGLRIPVAAAQCLFGGVAGSPYQLAGKSYYLLQYDSDKFAVRKEGEALEWDKDLSGNKAPGWIKVSGDNGSVLMFIKDFWQQFPKELEAVDQALVFHAWPAHGIAKPGRKVEDAMIQYLWFCHEGKTLDFKVPEAYSSHKEGYSDNDYRYLRGSTNANCMGLAKTHELFLTFEGNDKETGDKKIFALWENNPVCMASPEQMCSAGVFGKLHYYDPAKFPEAEKGLSRAFDCERRLEDHTKDYGMFNFGDGHTCWDLKRNRWVDMYRCWRGFHHGAPRVPWILYVRSGDLKYLQYGIRNARHLMDIDVCNHTTPELEKKGYPEGKIPGALCDYKGIVHWYSGERLFDYNCLTDFMLYYYYLTGDRRGLEAAQQWGESVKKKFEKKFENPFGCREGAGVISSLIDLYQATWDEDYRKIIDKMVDYMFTTQNMGKTNQVLSIESKKVLPYGAFPQWENYAPWLEKYWDLTGDEKAGKRIVAWADAYIAGWGDSCSHYGIQINIPAYAYFVSQDPKYLSYGLKLMNCFLSRIENSPGTLLDGFAYICQVSLGYGYMAQRIPYFLQALSEAKAPVEETWASSDQFPLPFTVVYAKGKNKNIDFVILKERDTDINIILKGMISYTNKSPLKVSVISPSEETVETEFILDEGVFKVDLTVPADGETGVYQVNVSRRGGSWYLENPVKTEPELKLVFPVKGRTFMTNGSGTNYYFMVPEKTKSFTVKTVSSGYYGIFNPDGKMAAKIMSTPGKETITEITPEPGQTGKLWEIRGSFSIKLWETRGSFSIDILSKDTDIPAYFAADPKLFFSPESIKK